MRSDGNAQKSMETGPEENASNTSDNAQESGGQEQSEEERVTVKAFIDDLRARDEWRSSLREKNSSAASASAVVKADLELDDMFGSSKLDSSLKKNNAFIRKLKNFNETSKDSLISELRTLNVSKYLSEIASALTEVKLKMSGVSAAVEMCSEIHQNYSEFACSLHFAWTKIFAFASNAAEMKKKNKNTSQSSATSTATPVMNASKTRVDLRFYCELISVGVFTLKASLPLLGHIITFLASPPIEVTHLSLLTVFCKYCGDDFAGLRYTRKIQTLALKHQIELPDFSDPLLPPERRHNVRTLLTSYFNSVSAQLASEWKELAALDKSNHRILLTKGELHSDRKEKAETLRLSVNRLETSLEQLSDWLHLDMPVKEKFEDEDEEDQGNVRLDVLERNEVVSDKWEDEEMRDFYENLPDLKAFVPAILYKSEEKEEDEGQKTDDTKVEESEEDIRRELEMEEKLQVSQSTEATEENEEELLLSQMDKNEDLDSESVVPSQKLMLDAFLSGLQNCASRETIDNAAADFCLKFNNKLSRRRLSKFLFSVPRQRLDLLPFYARLIAILKPVASDVANDVVALLGSDFRYQLRKKDQMRLESKLKICRFIAELVKFDIYPKSEVLFHLKQLLFVFTHHHIEMFCALMEGCGRFLYCCPLTHTRTKIYLEQMIRKKKAMSLDERYSVMIENAFYTVVPSRGDGTRSSKESKKSGLELYYEKLLYHNLEKGNSNKILKQLRKNDWKSNEKREAVFNIIVKAWNVKYYNIQHLASVVAGLVPYHDWLGVRLVDSVLEEIRVQLESSDKSHNQRRISTMRFLAELYNYRVLDSSVVFRVLYLIISFVYYNDEEQLLRLRLVCVLLEASGAFLRDAKSSRKKLQYFMAFFQRFFWQCRLSFEASSQLPFPFMVSNLVSETLSSLKMPLVDSLEEAEKKYEETQKELVALAKKRMPQLTSAILSQANTSMAGKGEQLGAIAEESEDEDEDDKRKGASQDEDEDDEEEEEEDADDRSNEEKSEEEDDDNEDYEDNVDNDDTLEPKRVGGLRKIACAEDDEFCALLDQVVNDSLNESGSRAGIRGVAPVAPVVSRQRKTLLGSGQPSSESQTMQFSLLVKKGGKSGYKDLAVPSDSDMAKNLLMQEEIDRQEKERVKRLTLQINERQEEEDLMDALAAMQRPSVSDNRSNERIQYQHPRGVPDASLIFGTRKTPR